jgi:hypothetical protein
LIRARCILYELDWYSTTYCRDKHRGIYQEGTSVLTTCSQLVKKFPAFDGTQKLITVLSSARPILSHIHASPSHLLKIHFIIILLRLGLPSGVFPSTLPTKTLYDPLLSYSDRPKLVDTTNPTTHGDWRLYVQNWEAPDDGRKGARNM